MAYDPITEIKRLKELQKQQTLTNLGQKKTDALNQISQYQTGQQAQFGRTRDNSLSQLGKEKATIKPQYYNARNQTSTASQLQAKNFAEYIANRGLANSGSAAQAELNRSMALQSDIGALNQQEQANYDDIGRRETDVNNLYNSNISELESIINQRKSGAESDYTNSLNSAYSDIDADYSKRMIEAQKYMEQLAREKEQQEYARRIAEEQFKYQQEQDLLDNNFRQSQFDYQKQQDALARASRGGGGRSSRSSRGGSSRSSYMTKTQIKNANKKDAWNSFTQASKKGAYNSYKWLQKNGKAIESATDKATLSEMKKSYARSAVREAGEYARNRSSLVNRMFGSSKKTPKKTTKKVPSSNMFARNRASLYNQF